MRKSIFIFLVFLLFTFHTGAQTTESWTRLGDFPSMGRMGAVSFELAGYGYVGTGKGSDGIYRKDFWRYDPVTDSWSQRQDVGGVSRYLAIGFAIGSRGYIGAGNIGSDQLIVPANDFYEYDPSTDTWLIRPSIGPTGRIASVGFVVNGKGYVTTGFLNVNQYDNNTYEYDPAANGGQGAWSQKASFPGGVRHGAGGFSASGKGYLIGGEYANPGQPFPISYKQTWAYSATTNTWSLISNTSPPSFINSTTAFAIGNKGYVLGQPVLSGQPSNFWKFDPNTNSWSPRLAYPYSMIYPTAFSICGKGYVTADHFSQRLYKYVDPVGLEGPDVVCATASYTAPSVILWSTSNPSILTIDQQGVATRVGSANGAVVITANQCSGYLQKTVWVGSPPVNGNTLIYVGNQRGVNPVTLSPSTTYQFNCDIVPYATTYTWGLPPRSGFTFSSGQGTSSPYITTSSTAGTYTLTCRVSNACGFGYTSNLTVIIQSGGGGGNPMFAISTFPNPASSSLNVAVTDSTSSSNDKLDQSYYLVIRDKSANIVFQTVSEQKQLRIPIDEFPSDNYFLRIFYKNDIQEKQIVIKH